MNRTAWKPFFASVLLPIAIGACATDPTDSGDDQIDDGKGDGQTTRGTYFECSGLATNNTVWLGVESKAVVVTIEGAGVNTGKLTTVDSSSKTFSDWSSKVFFGAGDTLVIPDSLLSTGSGKVEWNIANVNPHWEGTCHKQKPTGDQCLPLVEQIYPVDSSATATYQTVTKGHYTVDIPNSRVGDFFYKVNMTSSGILCTQGDVTPTSCSAIVADAIGSRAFKDGSSSGQPYVSGRSQTASGYAWKGGVHDAESGDFAYTLTTDSDEDGCNVTGITNVSQ